MYLLMARLRRMARPLRYRIVNTKTENKAKRMAITPSTMAVVACLKTKEEDERMSHCLHLILNQTIWNTAEQLTQKCNGMTQHSLQFLDRSTYTQNTGRGEFEINTNIHTNRALVIAYPWVQLTWHVSQRPSLLGYLKMTSSPPITPSGHEETQCGPSCMLAHTTHWSAPFKERQ